MKLSKRDVALIKHDAALFASAVVTQLVAINGHYGRDVVIAAVVTAVKQVVRKLVPVPPAD